MASERMADLLFQQYGFEVVLQNQKIGGVECDRIYRKCEHRQRLQAQVVFAEIKSIQFFNEYRFHDWLQRFLKGRQFQRQERAFSRSVGLIRRQVLATGVPGAFVQYSHVLVCVSSEKRLTKKLVGSFEGRMEEQLEEGADSNMSQDFVRCFDLQHGRNFQLGQKVRSVCK